MRKSVILAGGALLVMFGIMTVVRSIYCASSSNQKSDLSDLTVVADLQVPGQISHGSYVDVASSLKEMARAADLVVIATVDDQKQFSSLSVASRLNVSRMIKGTLPSLPVIVYQFGSLQSPGHELLGAGVEYFLFLGKQTDSVPNTFYIKGGQQGLFVKADDRLEGDALMLQELAWKPGTDPFLILEKAVLQAIR